MVVDDEDDSLNEYIKVYGKESVLVFNKSEVAKTFDEFDNSEERRSVVYARNACFDLAKQLGYTYFLELDDDYKEFQFRYIDGTALRLIYPLNVDDIFDAMLDYYKTIPAKTIAMAQNGDFLRWCRWR